MTTTEQRHVYIWEFEVEAKSVHAFLRYYGADGEWATLFRRARGYLGTWLLNDAENPHRYVTVDRWHSRADLDAFLTEYRTEYDAMDQTCESFTRREASLGAFTECTAAR